MTAAPAPPRDGAPLVVFDFDHTLYDGDSGTDLFRWLIARAWWRRALALALAPVAGPLVAFLPTRRAGISAFVWAGIVGVHARTALDALIDRYVATHAEALRARLLSQGLAVLERHLARGDRVLVATGAPPELARAILALAGHGEVPVVGTLLGPRLGGMGAHRHCHHAMKMTMIRAAGYAQPVARAYSDSSADLPLLQAAVQPVVVNPKPGRVAWFRRVLPPGTPILHWGSRGRGGDPA